MFATAFSSGLKAVLAATVHAVIAWTDTVPPVAAIAVIVALWGLAMLVRVVADRWVYGEPLGGRAVWGSVMVSGAFCIAGLAIH